MYVVLAAGPLVPAARAQAFASVDGNGAEIFNPIERFGSDSQPILTDQVTRSDSGSNGSWSALAFASGPLNTKDITRKDIILKAQATAQWLGAASPRNPSATAFARWTDVLKFENPEVLDARVFTEFFVFFQPFVSGTISGARSSVHFEVIAADQFQSFDTTVEKLQSLGISGDISQHFSFAIPASDFLADLGNLRMTLSVGATTLTSPAPYFSEADFSHTAELPQLILADADGNYVPGTELLRIVGTSGLEYSVAAAPEPATAALLALGGVSLLSLRGRRRRID